MIEESANGVNWFLDRAAEQLLEPFSSWDKFLFAISHGLRGIIDIQNKMAWLYLISSFGIAWFIYKVEQRKGELPADDGFLGYVFPREIYCHPSAKVDYKFAAIDNTIQLLFYMPFITGFSYLIHKGVVFILSDGLSLAPFIGSRAQGTLTTFILLVLVMDFGFFISHYLMHKVPLLWEFHKVHHSAEVLTPVTVLRSHPVETLITFIVGSIFGAIVAGTYAATSGEDANLYTVFSVNVVTFAFYLFASSLRHSHIWLSYGKVLSHVFISPAQHQIHHSKDPKHWNKNFGYIFAIWDVCIRSLYVPLAKEKLELGLPNNEDREYASVMKLYFLPFKKAVQRCSPFQSRTHTVSSSLHHS